MANATGPRYPSAAADGGGGDGGPWTNLANAYASDGSYTNGDISGGGYSTSYLQLTGFGFAIPSTAVIVGVVVEIQRTGTNAQDKTVQLIKGGTRQGGNRALTQTTIWPASEAYAAFGGITDLWDMAITPADVNASNFGIAIQAQNTHGGGTASVDTARITVYWQTGPAKVPKRYLAKVYRDGAYLGNLPALSSDFGLTQEINTGGSQCTLVVPQSIDISALPTGGSLTDETGAALTDESGNPLLIESADSLVALGTGSALIRNGNRIVVWEYGYYYPNGQIAFQGEIERWEATMGGEDQDESITILCYSDGSDLDNYIVLGSPFVYTVEQSQTSTNASFTISKLDDKTSSYNFVGQTFTTGTSQTNLGGIYLRLQGVAGITVTVYDSPAMNTVLASSDVIVSNSSPTDVLFGFANHIPVSASTQYFFTVTCDSNQNILIFYASNNPYAGGAMYVSTYGGGGGGGYVATPTGSVGTASDLYFKAASSSGQTVANFAAQDPVTGIAASFMSDYRSRGGLIQSNSGSLQATGLSLPYNFNTNTVYEGLQAMLSISPNGFYYFVDPATNILTFKQVSTGPDILFTKGVHVNRLRFVATIENIYNLAYFSGGKIGEDATDPANIKDINLYKVYQDAGSLKLYKQKLNRLSDNRVVDSNVADAIGASNIAANKSEQYQTSFTVIDKQMDISKIKPGMTAGFRGYGGFMDQLVTQIVRVERTGATAGVTVGTLPPRIPVAMDTISRALIAQQTIANPSTPS